METLLLLALAAALVEVSVPGPPPRLTIVSHSFDIGRCQLNVRWNASAESVNHACKEYHSVVWTDGIATDALLSSSTDRTMEVELGKNLGFGVREECGDMRGKWVNVTLQQNGTAGTGAVNIECTWFMEKDVECSWQPGKKAPAGTHYTLSYWHEKMKTREQRCSNYTWSKGSEGTRFGCRFELPSSSGLPKLHLLLQGNTGDIQPVCVFRGDTASYIPEIFDPPSISNLSNVRDGILVEWTRPVNRNNLCYQVEDNKKNPYYTFMDLTKEVIPVEANEQHTFRVRVSQRCDTCPRCWSDWSKEKVWKPKDKPPDKTFKILLCTMIPFIVIVLTIILLIYLKSIRRLILPTIPDPGKFLKLMFEDQNEDLQKQPPEDPLKDEQTHPLTVMEPIGNEN
ncbi:interleukin-13 receptor subunit alpha-1 [Hemicordylus capensis]|uniref:interleukin-13 receptor subunit alpha-1 n=1 Tax=Hemicordylus capensis TaxID=884348 RepID=UPI0023041160|nr:interleukin-13 receptor subunit alpha-1 [Hemicordylus capensis]